MADNAAPAVTAPAAPAAEGSPPNGATAPPQAAAGGAPPPAGAKPGDAAAAKPADPKPNWDAATKAEKAAREKVKAAETRAKAAEDAAASKVAELEAKLAAAAPDLDLMSKKDIRALLRRLDVSAVDVANLVADEGKPPTVEEIEARAAAKALAEMKAEKAKQDETAAEAKRKADEKAAADAKSAADEKFAGVVRKQFTSVEAEMKSEGSAEKYKALHVLDKLLPALGLDKGHDDVEYGQDDKGEPLTVRMAGGTASSRSALTLVLQAAGRGEKISVTDALAAVQAKALTVLQQIAELPEVAGQATKKTDKQTPGRAAQPTLNNRTTTAPVTAPASADDEDEPQLGAPMSAVSRAIARVPGLAARLTNGA